LTRRCVAFSLRIGRLTLSRGIAMFDAKLRAVSLAIMFVAAVTLLSDTAPTRPAALGNWDGNNATATAREAK
jgi:hypothetical protein